MELQQTSPDPLSATFSALADPTRRAILARLSSGEISVTELAEPRKIFEGDGKHPPLWQRQAFAVLPFQVDPHRFVIAVYAMTYDATKHFEPEPYRVSISGLPGWSKLTSDGNTTGRSAAGTGTTPHFSQ